MEIDLFQNFVVERNRASGHFHRPSTPISAADDGVTLLLPLAAARVVRGRGCHFHTQKIYWRQFHTQCVKWLPTSLGRRQNHTRSINRCSFLQSFRCTPIVYQYCMTRRPFVAGVAVHTRGCAGGDEGSNDVLSRVAATRSQQTFHRPDRSTPPPTLPSRTARRSA